MELTNPKELRSLLERHGFRFSKGLGQNFLIDASVPRRIADFSELDERHWVLEIGPGVGCLTRELAERAGRVTAVEKDDRLVPVLAETLAGYDNVSVVNLDFLKLDLEQLAAEHSGGLTPVVCANLPYNITSPILAKLLESRLFESITVMIQREVAERLCAEPNTSDYGSFTVFVNWHSEPEILFSVSPSCFMPPPKVTSSVIRLRTRKNAPAEVPSEELFFRVVRASFAQRRKTLANALAAGLGGISKDDIARAIAAAELPERVRGEVLGIPEFANLARILYGEK